MMHTPKNIDAKTCIAELKSDIVKVTLQIDKIKSVTGSSQYDSRSGAEISNKVTETAKMASAIKTLTTENINESRLILQNLLNQKMVEMETLVLELISDAGDQLPSSSGSRLEAWTQLIDRHLWTYSSKSSTPRAKGRTQQLKSDQIAPIHKLLEQHSIPCNAKPNAPDYLAVAVDAIRAKIGELYKKIEGQRAELHRMMENPDQELEEETEVDDIRHDLFAANKNVVLLTKRVHELGKVTSDVQKTLTKEKADHEVDLQLSKKCRNEWQEKVKELETESTAARRRIVELESKLKLPKKRDSKSLTCDHKWEIKIMREKQREEIEGMRDKHRKNVNEVMRLQESNGNLMKALTTRDLNLDGLRIKDQSYYNVVSGEAEAMKKAFEIKLNSVKRELELAKAQNRRMARH